MTQKNDIIERVINKLLEQREDLSRELRSINHNETSYIEKRTTLDKALIDIDMQIDRRIMDCELTPINNSVL